MHFPGFLMQTDFQVDRKSSNSQQDANVLSNNRKTFAHTIIFLKLKDSFKEIYVVRNTMTHIAGKNTMVFVEERIPILPLSVCLLIR